MGYIKEPEGVDFIIQSKPLTDEERNEISKYIQDYKANQLGKKPITKTKVRISSFREKLDLTKEHFC